MHNYIIDPAHELHVFIEVEYFNSYNFKVKQKKKFAVIYPIDNEEHGDKIFESLRIMRV